MINNQMRMRIEQYWANELGCSIEMLKSSGVNVLLRQDSPGAFIFRYGNSCIWHVPKRFLSAVETAIANNGAAVDAMFQETFIAQLFGPAVQLILGPCPIGYCDADALRLDRALPTCRKLTPDDAASIDVLATNCGPQAWEHGGVDLKHHQAVFGCFVEQQLVAAASYEIWANTIAHVGVATAPLFQARGYGKAAAAAATADALREGLVPQWRTLASNLSSVAVGRAIGYETAASHFFVRLASA